MPVKPTSTRKIGNKKEAKKAPTTNCPNCGKEMPHRFVGEVKFCSLVCETNYRYRQKMMDPRTGSIPTAEEVNKWKP